MDGIVDAAELLESWRRRTIATLSGSPNRILEVTDSSVRVATGRSGNRGELVPLADVQHALEFFAAGDVVVHPEQLGHRSSFCGAVIRTLPGAVVARSGSRQTVARRQARQAGRAYADDLGAIRPWWANDSRERYWMEITDRADIGTDLHCPQRDTDDDPTLAIRRSGSFRPAMLSCTTT